MRSALAELVEARMPMVMVNRRPDGLDVTSVVPDDASGIRLAVEHLAGLGHRRIAHLAGPVNTSTGLARARAFRLAISDLDLDSDPRLVKTCSLWDEAAGAESLRELLDEVDGVTAIVAGNDLLALGCYDVFAERGISCPNDISVIGFNNLPFLGKLNPPLTSVYVPHREIGVEAGRLLLEAIADPSRPSRSVLLPLSLVVRGSTSQNR